MLSVCSALVCLLSSFQAETPEVYAHGKAWAAYSIKTDAEVKTHEAWVTYRASGGELLAGGEGEVALTFVREHRVAAFEDRPAYEALVFELPELPWRQKKPLQTGVTAALDLILTSWQPNAARDFGRHRSGKVGKFKGLRLPVEMEDGRAGYFYVLNTPGDELAFLLWSADEDALNKASRDFERAFKSLVANDPLKPAAPLAKARWGKASGEARSTPVPSDLRAGLSAGTSWLINNQDPDGGWTIAPGTGNTANQFGVVGLALHALVEAAPMLDEKGQTACENAAHRAAGWLLNHRANADTPHPGVFGPIVAGATAYNHLVATRGLLAYRAKWRDAFRAPVEVDVGLNDAITLIQTWQKESGGWSYAVSRGEEPERWDSSITSWALLCLVAAHEQGLKVDDDAMLRGANILNELASEETGRIGYCLWIELGGKGGLPARLAQTHSQFPSHGSESLTAIGFHAQQSVWAALGRNVSGGASKTSNAEDAPASLGELAVKQIGLMLAKPPVADEAAYDLYYWAHAAHALAAVGGPERAAWEAAAAQVLLARQEAADSKKSLAGSWAPESAWAIEGDRAYTTAQALLTLAAWGSGARLVRGLAEDS